MAKLTTYIVAAALSGAAVTGAVVGLTNSTSQSNSYEAPEQSHQVIMQQAVAPAVVPQNSYSGGTKGGSSKSDAVVVPIASQSSSHHDAAASSSKALSPATPTQVAPVYGRDNSDGTFTPRGMGGDGSIAAAGGVSSMTLALNTNNYLSTSGSGFVGISRRNAQQNPVFAAAGTSSTAPPPPGDPDPQDQLPLAGNLLELLLCILSYASVNLLRSRKKQK